MESVDRSTKARATREPDLFLSHSSRDKDFVRSLAEHLSRCGSDVWLDEWELQVGDSLHDVIGHAASRAKFVGVVVGASFTDSPWANDEMKIGLAREKDEKRTLVLPLLVGSEPLPPFLRDRLFLDFREKHFEGVARLAALLHDVPRQAIEEAIEAVRPTTIGGTVSALRYAGYDPPIALPKEDVQIILSAGGYDDGQGGLFFSPRDLLGNPTLPQRLRNLMQTLIKEAAQGAEEPTTTGKDEPPRGPARRA